MVREYPPKIIVIDFDGTLCKFAFPDVGPPEPNVKEALIKLKELGYKICIHSVRTATYRGNRDREHHIRVIEKFMEENELPYDEILTDSNMDKPIAAAYIDDKAIRYEGDWLEIVKNLGNK